MAGPVSRALARRIAELRAEGNVRQVDLAEEARAMGLNWSANTIASLETGRRDLMAEELVVLPTVLTRLLGREVTMDDLLTETVVQHVGKPLIAVEIGEPERKAARRLGVPVERLMEASEQLWGHPLTVERDRRVPADAPPRVLQAKRSHTTRALMAELERALNDN